MSRPAEGDDTNEDAAPEISLTPTMTKSGDQTMAMNGQNKIAATPENGNQGGENSSGSAHNARDSNATQDEDDAAVSKESNNGHANDRANNNQALQPASVAQMVEQPKLLVATDDEMKNGSVISTTVMVNDTTSEHDTSPSPQQKKEVPIDDTIMAEPVRKGQRSRIPSFKYATDKNDEPILAPKLPALVAESNRRPNTPQELYDRIKKSQDKLFFVAYSHNKDPLVTPKKTKKGNNKMEYQWHLVRVDLSTCAQLEDCENCEKTGKYYVEFYTKASYDKGIVLAGNPLENGIPSAKMKCKADSDSRYWLEWHEYYFDKNGDMVVGKAKEFLPNSKKAIHRRLMDLYQRKRKHLSSPGSSSSTSSEGEERLMSEYLPDFDKYTTWADVIDLMDAKTLVGPFNFDDVKPPPLKEKDLAIFNQETKDLFSENHSKLYVKDRIHLSRWQELTEAVKGREIDPPTIPLETNRKKKRVAGSKRVREDTKGPVDKSSGQAKKITSNEVVTREGGEGATEREALLFFPATSSAPSLTKKRDDQTIMPKKDVLSLVERILTQIRQATSADGEAYYVFGEVKEALNQALGSWTRGMTAVPSRKEAEVSTASAKTSEPLEGFSEANFTEEEISGFPMAFAYNHEDPGGISEKNAKIATLDYEVEQRRLKRSGQSKSPKGPPGDKNNHKASRTTTKPK